MPQTTTNPEQRSAHGEDRPAQAKAARAYQKVKLTESTEEELLETYAPVISQMVHRFVRELADSDHSPAENVIVFDEAQRAWDAKQMETKQGIAKSEAQITLEIMSRTKGWSVVVPVNCR